jgi:hypothetical protein
MDATQYGVVPVDVQLVQSYSVANPNTWRAIQRVGDDFVEWGGVEEYPVFSAAQIAEIESLGGRVFASSIELKAFLGGFIS